LTERRFHELGDAQHIDGLQLHPSPKPAVQSAYAMCVKWNMIASMMFVKNGDLHPNEGKRL
jgi:hypothetical protein